MAGRTQPFFHHLDENHAFYKPKCACYSKDINRKEALHMALNLVLASLAILLVIVAVTSKVTSR